MDSLVGHPEYLWIARQQVLGDRILQMLPVTKQLSESTTEGDVLFGGQALVAQYQHSVVLAPRPADLCEQVVAQGMRDVQAGDFDSQSGAQAIDRQFHTQTD